MLPTFLKTNFFRYCIFSIVYITRNFTTTSKSSIWILLNCKINIVLFFKFLKSNLYQQFQRFSFWEISGLVWFGFYNVRKFIHAKIWYLIDSRKLMHAKVSLLVNSGKFMQTKCKKFENFSIHESFCSWKFVRLK